MRKDGELHAEEDGKSKEELETSNRADNAVYRKERLLKDNQEKISGNNRGKVESVLNEVKEALKGSDAAAIKMASEKLNETWQTVSAELCKAASEKARAGQDPLGGNSETTQRLRGLRKTASKVKLPSLTLRWQRKRRQRSSPNLNQERQIYAKKSQATLWRQTQRSRW